MSLRPQLTFDYAGHTAEEPLTHAPDGWDEQMVKYVRNKKYYGLFRSFTIPLKFVKDGATKLRKDFYTYGLDADASLTINLLNPETDTYSVAFTGKFDFSTFKDNETFVEINLVDGGLAKLIKDNEGVEYEVAPFKPFIAPSTIDDLRINYDRVGDRPDKLFKAMEPLNFLKLLVDEMTNGRVETGEFSVDSVLLGSSLIDKLALTTGWYLRNNDTIAGNQPERNIKTSFKDFFKSLDAVIPIGIGVEIRNGKETLVLEERSYFFDNQTTLIDLGDVNKFELSVYKDFNFSVVKTGYPEKDYDDSAYSNNEFNVEVELLAPNPTSSDDYEIRSKYRADGQGIQQIFDNSDGTPWDKDGSDEDIFWVEIINFVDHPTGSITDTADLSSGEVRKKDEPGITFDTWNAWLSPKQCLLRHRLFIDSALYNIINLPIEFMSGGKDQTNNETQSPINFLLLGWLEEYIGYTTAEFVDLQYFQPFEIRFDAPYPHNIISIVEANPRGVIRFTYNGYDFTGYILELEMKLTGRGSQSIKLLSTRTNNLKNLIRS